MHRVPISNDNKSVGPGVLKDASLDGIADGFRRGVLMNMVGVGSDNRAFTLVELMVAVVISGMVLAALFFSYTAQRKIHTRQEAVVDMQQNLRSGAHLIARELRMAGYDRSGAAGAGITAATGASISFTQDLDENGDVAGPNERVTIAMDSPKFRITRNTGGGNQTFIDNVEFAEFAYTLDDGTATNAPLAGTFDRIRVIDVSILMRTAVAETGFVNAFVYTTPFGTVVPGSPFNDGVRRRFLSVAIQCRNIGMSPSSG